MTALKVGLLAALISAAHAAAALNMEIIPAAPRYQEPVVARLVRPALNFGVIYGATTSMQGNTITVVYFEYPELSTASHDVSLGQLPAGTYTVQLKRSTGNAIEATAQFTVGTEHRGRTGTLAFGDAQTGTLNFVVDGVRTIKPLARLPSE